MADCKAHVSLMRQAWQQWLACIGEGLEADAIAWSEAVLFSHLNCQGAPFLVHQLT